MTTLDPIDQRIVAATLKARQGGDEDPAIWELAPHLRIPLSEFRRRLARLVEVGALASTLHRGGPPGSGTAKLLGLPAPKDRTPADILRHAVGYLDSGAPAFAERPTVALYQAVTRAQASASPRGREVHAAVVSVMQKRHPDWPTEGSLIRLVEEEGPAALREVLVAASQAVTGGEA